eukprot:365962-Chlamydomonas_euryale.AAC.5
MEGRGIAGGGGRRGRRVHVEAAQLRQTLGLHVGCIYGGAVAKDGWESSYGVARTRPGMEVTRSHAKGPSAQVEHWVPLAACQRARKESRPHHCHMVDPVHLLPLAACQRAKQEDRPLPFQMIGPTRLLPSSRKRRSRAAPFLRPAGLPQEPSTQLGANNSDFLLVLPSHRRVLPNLARLPQQPKPPSPSHLVVDDRRLLLLFSLHILAHLPQVRQLLLVCAHCRELAPEALVQRVDRRHFGKGLGDLGFLGLGGRGVERKKEWG